jgi:hypothetical protein
VIHAHRYPYGMMVRGRSTADAVPAGLAAVTVLVGPGSAWMAGLRRPQTPPGTTPVTAGYNPGIRPRPARPQTTPEPRLAPAPTLIQDLDAPVAQGPLVRVTVAATPSTSTPHPEALPATDE